MRPALVHRPNGFRPRWAVRTALLLGILFAASGVADAGASRTVRFQHVSQDDGLSESFVLSIVQDRQGYMWFGTQAGLNRFDGRDFTVFSHDPADPRSISDESVRTLIEDRSGVLWVGTDAGGLSRYDAASQTFTNYRHDPEDPSSISGNRIRVLYEDHEGVLWIGTDGTGLDRFDRESETFERFQHDPSVPDSLSGNHVWNILHHSDDSLWVATDGGLSRFSADRRSFTHFRHDPEDPASISDSRSRVLYEDEENALWIGTETGGLNRFDRDTGSFERFVHDPDDVSSISANRINTIFQDDAGVLWIGTVKGLNAWNPATGNFDRYLHDPNDRYSLSHDTVLSMFQDRGKIIWIGTYDGLNLWNPATRTVLHYREDAGDPQSLNQNAVTSFAEDRAGGIWIGTFGGGLNVLDRATDRFRHLRNDPDDDTSLSSDRVMTMRVDSGGVLWVGTLDAGLNRYDENSESFNRYRHDPEDPTSLSNDGVSYVLESSNGDLWVGTFGGGLNRFDRSTRQFTHYRSNPDDPTTISNDRILVLFEDSAGDIWVGTYGGGLNHFDPDTGTFTRFEAEPDRFDGLSGGEINMIQEDSRGDLWVGVRSGGLNRWQRSDREAGKVSFQRFTQLDGLPSSTIYSGVWDRAGHLWLGSGRGLSRLDVESLTFKNYDTGHGLQSNEFNLSAGLRASDGQIFFGGVNGFNSFNPDELRTNQRPPQVVITRLLGLNDPVDLSGAGVDREPVELSYEDRLVGFEFAALDYAAPENNRFMYKLEGLDEDWIDAGTRHQVTYTNLPAGNYTFRVRAANNDGIWSVRDARLDLRLNPPPWRTWWAYTLYALVLVAASAYWINARRTQKKAERKYTEKLWRIWTRWSEAQRIASIGNWEWNIATNELWWSNGFYRLLQMNPHASGVTYKSFLKRVHPDDRRTVKRAITRALQGQEPSSMDHRIILPDGTERVMQVRAEVIRDEQRRPVRMAGTVYDVTERKKTEDNIKHRADYQALLARLSSELIKAQTDDIDGQLRDSLEFVATSYGLDAISVWWFTADNENLKPTHRWTHMDDKPPEPVAQASIPWISAEILASKLIVVDDVEQLPPSGAPDQQVLRKRGVKSFLIVPLLIEEKLRGACAFVMYREKRRWSVETVAELRLLAENLAGAIALSRAMSKIKHLKNKLQEENVYLREEVRLAYGFDEIIGEDPGLKRCLRAVEKVAPTDVTTLILGETGTGKELIARAIHKLSGRHDKPMICVNCPTLPANLIESELFGHEKGAFTGAQSQRLGRFELADTGTLFLDEVGELPLELQGKLLRVLQTGEFQRIGGTETLHADVRLIAATNRDLQDAVERNEFRADLYYRINSFPITLPALRDRKGDIPLLAEHFVHKHAGRVRKKVDAISAEMVKELLSYEWPGNVRELESIIERALISAEDNSVLTLPGPLRLIATLHQSESTLSIHDGVADLSSVERSHIISVLEQTQWKISGSGGAAALLGIPSSTLRSKMKRLAIVRRTP